MFTSITKIEKEEGSDYLTTQFEDIWNDTTKTQDITEAVIDYISSAYKDNAPEYLYYVTLYNIFKDFLDDVLSEDNMPNEATGFKDSLIWKKTLFFSKRWRDWGHKQVRKIQWVHPRRLCWTRKDFYCFGRYEVLFIKKQKYFSLGT